MKKHLLVSLFSLLISTGTVNAQLRVDRVIPPSFNAAAIIKYCDHPVGIKYGVPKIKIPIQTLIKDDLFVPISLNYHTIGIKVEEEATWAGLGWHLEAGGTITRLIRGENDLALADKASNSKALGYPFEHIKPCFDDCQENENDDFHEKVCAGEIDSDPDIFFFNILGMKGKFLLTPDHDSTTQILKIELVRPRQMTAEFYMADNYWKISDQMGYQYIFKQKEITKSISTYLDYKFETESTDFDFNSQTATTSWHMSKIISPSGVEATFKYDVNIDGVSKYLSNSAYHKMNINDEELWDVHYSSYCFPDSIENVRVTSEYLHSDVYLESITLGDYVAHFSKSEQDGIRSSSTTGAGTNHFIQAVAPNYRRQQLDKLEILQGGNSITSADFKFSKFKSYEVVDNPILNHRLKLDSMLLTKHGETKHMGFEYVEKYGLPSKESHARDLWGYYNGEDKVTNITPSDYFNYSQPEKLLQEEGKTKHYSIDHIKEGVIAKIDFGGGKDRTYQFDHQEFFDIDLEITDHFTNNMKESNFNSHIKPFIFGGLRVSEIVESYPKEKIYKDFFYTINRQESGKLIITHYSHEHHGYGHTTSGNHGVKYPKVRIKTGKLFNGHKF
ncbi:MULTISPECIES: hypothetical protein [Reichenbachiella]|uniref:YD repeat-containing protein n=1 Tax=Reichenbachiella agariperforans TaxID=156994 RepID=A0A1M6JKF9_REIAG|nr:MULTISPECIES: hypothetical protein [Reichenbachiella]MBU2913234.1 hypothetical protein [Reichenbachiella agariperforans]RJE74775.1 hypothetical protein BGP76_16720 [Reichenbachiella sp. MSK19-1]SHJ47154.1 hypothetical protein SAMN04488028_101227 [Reichenbachiella agariperforans]